VFTLDISSVIGQRQICLVTLDWPLWTFLLTHKFTHMTGVAAYPTWNSLRTLGDQAKGAKSEIFCQKTPYLVHRWFSSLIVSINELTRSLYYYYWMREINEDVITFWCNILHSFRMSTANKSAFLSCRRTRSPQLADHFAEARHSW
jgi:hypothetical protein